MVVIALLAGALLALVGAPAPSLAANWTTARLPGAAGKVFLLGVSCPSESLCVAVGTNNLIASSSNPTGGASAWRYGYAGEGSWPKTEEWPTENISGRQIQSVSCPSSSLCVAVTDQGFIYSSTDPTEPAASWRVVQVDDGKGLNTHLFGVSCPTTGFCVAVSGKREDKGKILTTTDPTGPAGAWIEFELGEPFEFRAVSCPSVALCVAVDEKGRIVASTNPAGGPSAWHVVADRGSGESLRSIDCLAAPLCLSGNDAGDLLTSTDPLAAGGAWGDANGGGSVQITGTACAAPDRCLAVDDNGDVVTSTDPTGATSPWSFANVLPFTSQEGNALFAASCPSPSLCALVGSRGNILASNDPFATDPGAPPGHRGGKKLKRVERPRVHIATLRLPTHQQLEHRRGQVMIRFYARAKVRGYVCELDRHGFRPCRSPKRYPIGVGHHVFRVRAIGYTGFRGPLASERFTIYPLCKWTPRRGQSQRPARLAARPLAHICS